MSSNSALEQAVAFLSALFTAKPVEHHLLVWELHKADGTESFRNHFFTDIEKAAFHAVTKQAPGTDEYFGVCTLAHKPRRGRGRFADMSGIGAIHIDVDIAHADAQVHKKPNLPPDLDSALAFVDSLGLPPSIIIHSGYGLHVYWLLQSFWQFSDDDDRTRAASMIETWQKMCKWRASHSKWDLDATQDLTRVLRIPGTFNYKLPSSPVQATTLSFNPSIRYTTEQFDEHLNLVRKELPAQPAQSSPAGTQTQAKNVTQIRPQPAHGAGHWSDLQLVLDDNASAPADKFEAAMENLPKFKLTWQHKRKDLIDQSPSAFDIALANMVMAIGWTPQETTNLLIQHRRKYSIEKMRLDYYQRTVFEAQQATVNQRAFNEERQQVAAAARAPVDPADKEAIKAALQRVLGFRIERIIKILSDPPQFILHFPNGKEKNIGDAFGLLDQRQFAKHVANLIGRVVPKMKDAIWEPTAQKLFDLAEEMPVVEETTELGEVKEIITQYLDEFLHTGITLQHHRQYAARHQPAVLDGISVHIHANELWKYARRNFGTKLSRAELINLMRRIGAERVQHTVRDDRARSVCVSMYALPESWTPAGAVKELAEGATAEDDDAV